jgi:DNA-binding FrmR family transcriptional regulator
MHRAGVDRAGRRRLVLPGLEEFLRLGLEAFAAARAAEQIFLSPVFEAVFCGFAVDAHPANRIDRDAWFTFAAMLAAATRDRPMMMAGVGRLSAVHVFHLRHCGLRPLEKYTLGGYMEHMRNEIKTSCLKRLKRIEGQIRGLAGMVEEDRYCIDVVTQIAAAKAALRRVEEEILRDHVAHCVEHAITSGDKADQRRKIAELMDVVGRADR